MRSLFYLSLLGFSFDAYAQVKNSLTWSDSVRLLLKDNPDYYSSLKTLQSVQMQESVDFADRLPQLSGTFSVNKETSLRGGTQSFRGESYSAGLNLSQSLFTGGRITNSIERSEFLTMAQAKQHQLVLVELEYELTRRFQNLIYAQELVGLSQTIVQRRRDNVDLLRLRFESGLEDKGSLLLSQANYAQAQYNYKESQDLLSLSQTHMAEILGVSDYRQLEVIGVNQNIDIDEEYQVIGSEIDFYELVKDLPAYQRSLYQLEASKKNMAIAKSRYFPQLNLSASLNSTGDDFFPDDTGRFQAGLSVSVPLFSGGRDYYRHQISVKEYRAGKLDHRSRKLSLISDVEQAYRNLKQSYKMVDLEDRFLQAAELRADIARSKYTNGLLSFEEWDRIETEYINRQVSALRVRRDQVFSIAQWRRILGVHHFNSYMENKAI